MVILFVSFMIVCARMRETLVMTADDARERVAQNRANAELAKAAQVLEKAQNEKRDLEERLRKRETKLKNVEEEISVYCSANPMPIDMDLAAIMKMVKSSEVNRINYYVDQPQVAFCVMDVLVDNGFFVEYDVRKNEMELRLDMEKGSRIVINRVSNAFGQTEWQIRCAGDYMPPNRVLTFNEKVQTLSDRNACALFQLEFIACFDGDCFDHKRYENVQVINTIGQYGV